MLGGKCGGSKPFSSRAHPECHTRHTLGHTHTHGPRTFYAPSTHRSKNEPAGLKNRSSDETRARLNHRNSPTAELAWRQGRGGPFSAATPEAGWITQTKLAPVDQKMPRTTPPLPGPAVPAPPAPDSEGPLHGSSAGRERTTKCGAHGDDQGRRRTGRAGTGVLEGGALVRGASPSTTCLLTTTTTTLFSPSSAPSPPFPFFGLVVNQIPCTLLDRLSSPVRWHVVSHRWEAIFASIFFACQ